MMHLMDANWWGVALGVGGSAIALILMRVVPRKHWDDSTPQKGDPDPYGDFERHRY
jgi:hypothetical protein